MGLHPALAMDWSEVRLMPGFLCIIWAMRMKLPSSKLAALLGEIPMEMARLTT